MGCRADVGVPSVGDLSVGIISRIFGVGGVPRGFTFIGGFGWGDLAVVFEVRGVVCLAVGSVFASFLAVFHPVGLDEMLSKKRKMMKEVKYKEKAIGDMRQSEHTTGGFC